jgi:hypothetical protein
VVLVLAGVLVVGAAGSVAVADAGVDEPARAIQTVAVPAEYRERAPYRGAVRPRAGHGAVDDSERMMDDVAVRRSRR